MKLPKGRYITRVGRRNQVAIPASMLRALCLGPGEQVLLRMSEGNVTLEKAEDPPQAALPHVSCPGGADGHGQRRTSRRSRARPKGGGP